MRENYVIMQATLTLMVYDVTLLSWQLICINMQVNYDNILIYKYSYVKVKI